MEECEHFSTEHDKLQGKETNRLFFCTRGRQVSVGAVDPLKEVCADGGRELLCRMKSTSSVSNM